MPQTETPSWDTLVAKEAERNEIERMPLSPQRPHLQVSRQETRQQRYAEWVAALEQAQAQVELVQHRLGCLYHEDWGLLVLMPPEIDGSVVEVEEEFLRRMILKHPHSGVIARGVQKDDGPIRWYQKSTQRSVSIPHATMKALEGGSVYPWADPRYRRRVGAACGVSIFNFFVGMPVILAVALLILVSVRSPGLVVGIGSLYLVTSFLMAGWATTQTDKFGYLDYSETALDPGIDA